MPLDTRIPLGVTPIDPNGFTNALAAGQKMRELQNASDRLAYKEELAVADRSALQNYLNSPRTPEDEKAFAAASPDGYLKAKKTLSDADNNAAQARNHQVTFAKANHQMLADATGAILANPTRENALTVIAGVEAQGGDMSRPRKQLESTPDQALPTLFKGWVGNAQKVQEMVLAEEKAKKPPPPRWDSYNARYVTPPSAGAEPTVASPGPTVAPNEPRRPTMEPGGSSGYSTDEIKAEIARVDAGGAPSPNFKMSRESLGTLLQAQTDLEGAQGGAAAPPTDVSVPPAPPVPDQPAPVAGPQTAPVTPPPPPPPPLAGGPPRSRAEADWANAQRQDAKDKESQRVAQETLDLKKGDYAAKERAAADKAAVSRGEKLTASDASKARLKLIRIEDLERQQKLVEDNYYGVKDDKGNVITKGIQGTFSAGPAASLYTLTPGGQKFAKSVESLAASKSAMLRVPGVGSSSNLDVELDRADLPSRDTYEETTEQQIKSHRAQIDHMLKEYRRVLNLPVAGGDPAPESAAPAVTATAQSEQPAPTPVKVAPLEDLNDMPLPGGKYKGKWVKDPSSGIVYRSDGSNWIKQ